MRNNRITPWILILIIGWLCTGCATRRGTIVLRPTHVTKTPTGNGLADLTLDVAIVNNTPDWQAMSFESVTVRADVGIYSSSLGDDVVTDASTYVFLPPGYQTTGTVCELKSGAIQVRRNSINLEVGASASEYVTDIAKVRGRRLSKSGASELFSESFVVERWPYNDRVFGRPPELLKSSGSPSPVVSAIAESALAPTIHKIGEEMTVEGDYGYPHFKFVLAGFQRHGDELTVQYEITNLDRGYQLQMEVEAYIIGNDGLIRNLVEIEDYGCQMPITSLNVGPLQISRISRAFEVPSAMQDVQLVIVLQRGLEADAFVFEAG